jgi:peroxisomal membrane protein 4
MSNLQQEIYSLLLFRDITLKQAPTLFKNICSMALEHGKNLGLFVFCYKAGYKLLNHAIKPSSFNHFLSGLIFGTLIFGKKTGVNHQIVLYLFSRVAIGLATMLYRKLG